MQKTEIQWSDYSSNPLKLRLRQSGKLVNACIKCSAGCASCYAESMTRRYWPKLERKFPGYTPALMKLGDVVLNDVEIQKLLTFKHKPPYKNGATPTVFIEDMSDIGGEFVSEDLLDTLFAVFALRPDVTFQILTKRPERLATYLAGDAHERSQDAAATCGWITKGDGFRYAAWTWPLPNVWLGTSVEDQQRADERIPHLLRCPAAVRFLSAEPLLGPIDLRSISLGMENNDDLPGSGDKVVFDALDGTAPESRRIDWVIVGCESGPGRRAMKSEWAQSIAAQCHAAGVAMFMKQLVVNGKVSGDVATFPPAVQVRQFPATAPQSPSFTPH